MTRRAGAQQAGAQQAGTQQAGARDALRRDIDVVVAGAGGAGLSAALAASQAGASVAIVEHRASFREGCNTAMSTAMIPAGGTRWQRAMGIDDSPDQFLDDARRKTHGTLNETVARALTNVAPTLVEWLADRHDVPLALVTDFHYPGHSADRCHTVPDRSGRTLHAHMLSRAIADERINLIVPARLHSVDPERSATLVFPDGATETVTCHSVILAAGGFGADGERVAEHIPDMFGAWHFGSDGNVGDALRIGEAVGADTGWLDAYQGHGSVATPHGVLVTWATVMRGGIIVNNDGERFDDETRGYSEYARRVLDQPGASAWMIIDERIDNACLSFKDHVDLHASGAIRRADTIGALATITGLAAEALQRTLSQALLVASGAAPDEFGRTSWESALTPPYAAIRITGALFHTQGGLLVDANAAVLRSGALLGGLYAAGGSACGMSGRGADGYLAGNGLLAAFGLGYLAGRAAGASACALVVPD